MKISNLFLLVLLFVTSCNKDKGLELDDSDLTTCPENVNCSYTYFNYADVLSSRLVEGDFRVFSIEVTPHLQIPITEKIYLIAPLEKSDFLITAAQIKAGGVQFVTICPSCLSMVAKKAVGGYVRGRKAENGQWLIEASIVISLDNNNSQYRHRVKQYFRPALKWEG